MQAVTTSTMNHLKCKLNSIFPFIPIHKLYTMISAQEVTSHLKNSKKSSKEQNMNLSRKLLQAPTAVSNYDNSDAVVTLEVSSKNMKESETVKLSRRNLTDTF